MGLLQTESASTFTANTPLFRSIDFEMCGSWTSMWHFVIGRVSAWTSGVEQIPRKKEITKEGNILDFNFCIPEIDKFSEILNRAIHS